MELYRLTREAYAESLSGVGAALKGARWNSIGIEMIYLASNRSLAMAEVAVHFSLATIPDDYMMMTVFIPDYLSIKKLSFSELPELWNVFPHTPASQNVGDNFIRENKCCILQVPSAVTQGDYNFLVNPFHSEAKEIKIIETVKFPFDKRIFA
jgi:RES domain-containing protein